MNHCQKLEYSIIPAPLYKLALLQKANPTANFYTSYTYILTLYCDLEVRFEIVTVCHVSNGKLELIIT